MPLLYQTHSGNPAISKFRSQGLASKLGAKKVEARYVHYVALTEVLSHDEQANLLQILTYHELPPGADDGAENVTAGSRTYYFYVFPRTGTISPWSSKATNIAHVCGLQSKVKRIERGTVLSVTTDKDLEGPPLSSFTDELHDRMTQTLREEPPDLVAMFAESPPAPATVISILGKENDPRKALKHANNTYGLALDGPEIDYLVHVYGKDGPLHRDPYLEELFMFSQINSEHCRHKQFNASWTIDGKEMPTLFEMIRNTHKQSPQHVVSAYKDNAAVLEGPLGSYLFPDWINSTWTNKKEIVRTTIKGQSSVGGICICCRSKREMLK